MQDSQNLPEDYDPRIERASHAAMGDPNFESHAQLNQGQGLVRESTVNPQEYQPTVERVPHAASSNTRYA